MSAFGWLGLDGTYSRKEHRQGVGTLAGGKITSRPLGCQSGVTSPVALSVTSTDWTVGSFTALLDLETDATMGVTAAVFDGDTTDTLTPASMSIDRWDLLSVTYADAGSVVPHIVYTAGTTAATLPATPSNSMALAKIVVPRSGTGSPSITLIAARAYAAGGVAVAANSSFYPANPYLDQLVYDTALDALLRWNGTVWGLPNQTGWQDAALAGSINIYGGPNPGSWRDGKTVAVRGLVVPSGGYTANHTYTAAVTLDAGHRPGADVISNAGTNGVDRQARLHLATDGTIEIITGGIAPTFVDLNCLSGFIAEN